MPALPSVAQTSQTSTPSAAYFARVRRGRTIRHRDAQRRPQDAARCERVRYHGEHSPGALGFSTLRCRRQYGGSTAKLPTDRFDRLSF